LLAVDAGVHLAAITDILETHKSSRTPTGDVNAKLPTILCDGPFAGLEIPHESAKANAAYITRSLVDTYLITHPHLDHISGFVVNTAALPGLRPKRLAGLPFTIEAFKNHIFNNIIWPNLSDENNGAGLVTYMRLTEGGSPALGDGEGKGYVEVVEGLGVKVWSVSHGHCIEQHSHRGSSISGPVPELSPHHPNPALLSPGRPHPGRSNSASSFHSNLGGNEKPEPQLCVYDSSTYFIRDLASGKEVVIFGDVEPDSLSLSPRNKRIWTEAAPKIVHGHLGGIFIECSYDDSREEDELYGHLAPRFLIEELKVLADEVLAFRKQIQTNRSDSGSGSSSRSSSQVEKKKRKRLSSNGSSPKRKHQLQPQPQPHRNGGGKDPEHPILEPDAFFSCPVTPSDTEHEKDQAVSMPPSPQQSTRTRTPTPTPTGTSPATQLAASNGCTDDLPLTGVKIIAMHIKDKLDDGPEIADTILEQLRARELSARLGCEFMVARKGESFYF
jgi:cAMP phosphodiesterase